MVKIDLITGFLGSGKTTFIQQYAKYLIDQGNRIAIIENDYGAINVDMMLLGQLQSDSCELEMVIGGSFEDHKRRLKTKLIAMAMQGYQRVIIEPSGIFDVDEFFDILREEPLDNWYEIGSVITIMDASLSDHLSQESDYLLVSQIATAGIIVLSKIQESSEQKIQNTIQHISQALDQFQCKKIIDENNLLIKDWSTLDDQDYKRLMNCSYSMSSHIKMLVNNNNDYQSLFFMNLHVNLKTIEEKAKMMMNNEKCGDIIRIKGFIFEEDQWYAINATKEIYSSEKINEGQNVIIVIGENLQESVISSILKEK